MESATAPVLAACDPTATTGTDTTMALAASDARSQAAAHGRQSAMTVATSSPWSAIEDDEVDDVAPLKPTTSYTAATPTVIQTSARRRSSNLSTRSSMSCEYVRTGRRTPSVHASKGSVGITDIASTVLWLVPVLIKTTASLMLPKAIRGRLRGRA